MNNPSPWDDIAVPASDYNVRQIAESCHVPCFWGRDRLGSCLFIVELKGDLSDQFRQQTVNVNGLDIDLRAGESRHQRLVLTLGSEIDRDIFYGFCRPLVAAITNTTDSPASLAVALNHIRRWKAFLAGGPVRLSPEAVRGLFSEITFLMELLAHLHTDAEAVESWLGPERSHQDFIYGNTSVEVKSVSGTERSSVRISSEDQLETMNDRLFLRVLRLSNLPDDQRARSLNQIVDDARSKLGNAEAIEDFDRKLAAHGYAPLPAYDEPRFVVSEVFTFKVTQEFPRLIRSQLPSALSRVSYDIRFEDLAPFGCANDSVFGGP